MPFQAPVQRGFCQALLRRVRVSQGLGDSTEAKIGPMLMRNPERSVRPERQLLRLIARASLAPERVSVRRRRL
jgi:hypothetical protein